MVAGLNSAAILASPTGSPGVLHTEKGLGEGHGRGVLAGARGPGDLVSVGDPPGDDSLLQPLDQGILPDQAVKSSHIGLSSSGAAPQRY